MVLRHADPCPLLLSPFQGRNFRAVWPGIVHTSHNLEHLQRMTQVDFDQAGTLFHFDPWWVLKDSRFQGLKWVNQIKKTNCASTLTPPASKFLYEKDLMRVLNYQSEATGFTAGSMCHTVEIQDFILPENDGECQTWDENEHAGWHLKKRWFS